MFAIVIVVCETFFYSAIEFDIERMCVSLSCFFFFFFVFDYFCFSLSFLFICLSAAIFHQRMSINFISVFIFMFWQNEPLFNFLLKYSFTLICSLLSYFSSSCCWQIYPSCCYHYATRQNHNELFFFFRWKEKWKEKTLKKKFSTSYKLKCIEICVRLNRIIWYWLLQ